MATLGDAVVLREPVGPRFGLAHLLMLRRNPIGHNTVLRERFGEVVRLDVFGTTLYAVYGMDAAEQVLLNRDRAFANGPAWSYFIGPFFRRGLMLLDFDEHLHHRRIMQAAFTDEAMRRYHALTVPHVTRLLDAWQPAEAKAFDAFKQLTLELALEIFVGLDLPSQEQRRINRAFIDAVRAGTAIVRHDIPGGAWHRGLRARRVLEEFFGEHLPAKRRDGGDDLFAQLCAARSDEGDEFSDEDVINHMIFLLMAAHDTTTITLTSMVYQLARQPAWQQRLRDISVAAGDLSYDEVVGLEVHERVMKEALRITAPVPTLPRAAVRETAVNGYRIPAGGFVAVAPYLNHYEPGVWHDAALFDPDRFSAERREDHAHRMAFQPFGGGVHKCIGMHVAGMQVRTIVHELLRRFTWSAPEGYTWPLDMAALPYPRDGLPLRWERTR